MIKPTRHANWREVDGELVDMDKAPNLPLANPPVVEDSVNADFVQNDQPTSHDLCE